MEADDSITSIFNIRSFFLENIHWGWMRERRVPMIPGGVILIEEVVDERRREDMVCQTIVRKTSLSSLFLFWDSICFVVLIFVTYYVWEPSKLH